MRLLIFSLGLTFFLSPLFSADFAGNPEAGQTSQELTVACTVPAIAGANTPMIEEETQSIPEDKKQEVILADSQDQPLTTKTLYVR